MILHANATKNCTLHAHILPRYDVRQEENKASIAPEQSILPPKPPAHTEMATVLEKAVYDEEYRCARSDIYIIFVRSRLCNFSTRSNVYKRPVKILGGARAADLCRMP